MKAALDRAREKREGLAQYPRHRHKKGIRNRINALFLCLLVHLIVSLFALFALFVISFCICCCSNRNEFSNESSFLLKQQLNKVSRLLVSLSVCLFVSLFDFFTYLLRFLFFRK